MKRAVMLLLALALAGLLNPAVLAAESTPATLPVITLKARPAPAQQGYLGWHCDSLLRDDYSRRQRPNCGQTSQRREAATRELELRETGSQQQGSSAHAHLEPGPRS